MGHFDLLCFEPETAPFIARDKAAMAESIEQKLCAAGKVVRVERARSESDNADNKADHARSFSLRCSVQCW
jgi:hypothetical protein